MRLFDTHAHIGLINEDPIEQLIIVQQAKQEHVEKIMSQVREGDKWVWFDDMVVNREGKVRKRPCILSLGKCGTSNIAHRKIALWDEKGTYAHDWRFIKNLLAAERKPRKILAGEYVVCHIPGRLDA